MYNLKHEKVYGLTFLCLELYFDVINSCIFLCYLLQVKFDTERVVFLVHFEISTSTFKWSQNLKRFVLDGQVLGVDCWRRGVLEVVFTGGWIVLVYLNCEGR